MGLPGAVYVLSDAPFEKVITWDAISDSYPADGEGDAAGHTA